MSTIDPRGAVFGANLQPESEQWEPSTEFSMGEAEPASEPRPSLLNGYPTGQAPPAPLPGRTAQQIRFTGARYRFAGAISGLPVFFESFFKQYQPWYAIGFVGLALVLIAISMVYVVRADRLMKSELRLGYTTVLPLARKVPGVFYFHPLTKSVVVVPGEPRPGRIPAVPKGSKPVG